jgi:hypothetical protein
MFSLYCDDSGTDVHSNCAVAACFVATTEQWEYFNKDWERANQDEGFGAFHMSDFVARKEQFAKPQWQDEAKRERTIKRLINIIVTRARYGFSVAVEKSAFDREMPSGFRAKYNFQEHYTFAVRMCLGQLLKWRRKYKYEVPIQFIFDQMSHGKGEIDKVFQQSLKDSSLL